MKWVKQQYLKVGQFAHYWLQIIATLQEDCYVRIETHLNGLCNVNDTVVFIVLGINTSVAPMYLSEIAPVKLRGALGTLNQFGIVTGILLGNIFGLSEVGKSSINFVLF